MYLYTIYLEKGKGKSSGFQELSCSETNEHARNKQMSMPERAFVTEIAFTMLFSL